MNVTWDDVSLFALFIVLALLFAMAYDIHRRSK